MRWLFPDFEKIFFEIFFVGRGIHTVINPNDPTLCKSEECILGAHILKVHSLKHMYLVGNKSNIAPLYPETQWGTWGACSVSCGNGSKSRGRQLCPGDDVKLVDTNSTFEVIYFSC